MASLMRSLYSATLRSSMYSRASAMLPRMAGCSDDVGWQQAELSAFSIAIRNEHVLASCG